MAKSEIDDIFSGKFSNPVGPSSKAKGKSKATDEPAAPSISSATSREKTKKRKRRDVDNTSAPSTSSPVLIEPKSKKSKGRNKDNGNDEEELEPESKVKRPRVVETVRDPSAAVLLPPQNPPNPKTKTRFKSSKGDNMKDAIDRFKDSRGVGPRKKTEEGFLVFKEDELGIRDEGGDTPLCPFDCNCCF